MPFVTDKQTLDDLNILGKYKNSSVLNLFNLTKTAGGERLLEAMFQQPLTDAIEINHRSLVFRYFESKALTFPFHQEELIAAGNYLSGPGASHFMMATAQTGRRKVLYAMGLRQEHDLVADGLAAAVKMLVTVSRFVSDLLKEDPKSPFVASLQRVNEIFENSKLKWITTLNTTVRLSFFQTVQYDYLLRSVLRTEMETILQLIYTIDVNIAVAEVAKTKRLSYANALPADQHKLFMEEGFHPCLEKAVPNSVSQNSESNMIFLTGANMAGKSTFMKAYGINIYLAHMGFPVAAKSMSFSVKDGMYTSINVPDDLNMGYSHFYAEVLRVKNIALEVSSPKNLIVIFDELFKGTNVKDAYDATLAVSAVFAAHRNCFYIISTHIVEVGEALSKSTNNLSYIYMPTEMNGKIPVYPYRAKTGISSDRHGMMIIENEGILDIIGD